jgi:hypothetical protein
MNTPIAELDLLATRSEGEAFPLHVAVGAPRFQEAPSTYSCEVQISLFESPLRPVHGESSLQALCLALRLALHLLASFVERGGRLTYPDGEPFDLEGYAIGQLVPVATAHPSL